MTQEREPHSSVNSGSAVRGFDDRGRRGSGEEATQQPVDGAPPQCRPSQQSVNRELTRDDRLEYRSHVDERAGQGFH